ncbi:hypothetical protein BDV98DRAFT_55124 [Pterulicium gracile]|uniref:Uncharacterized protein n=1 Tax=Pterulicium gracile TaxID=1884261 RepID=A0A5C3QNV4_9AGAR|nr:hypothetical protein BDV98DRAFT_55124 [Pterula gracilis]
MSRLIWPTKGTQKRILEADIHDGHCNLRNAHPEASVTPIALINPSLRRSEPDLMSSLEWNWGMRENTLNLYTRRNSIHLREDYLELFRQLAWMLLPDLE